MFITCQHTILSVCGAVKGTWTHVHNLSTHIPKCCKPKPYKHVSLWPKTTPLLATLFTRQEVSHHPFMTCWSCGYVWFHVIVKAGSYWGGGWVPASCWVGGGLCLYSAVVWWGMASLPCSLLFLPGRRQRARPWLTLRKSGCKRTSWQYWEHSSLSNPQWR